MVVCSLAKPQKAPLVVFQFAFIPVFVPVSQIVPNDDLYFLMPLAVVVAVMTYRAKADNILLYSQTTMRSADVVGVCQSYVTADNTPPTVTMPNSFFYFGRYITRFAPLGFVIHDKIALSIASMS